MEHREIEETRAAMAEATERHQLIGRVRSDVQDLINATEGLEEMHFVFFIVDPKHSNYCTAQRATRESILQLVEILALQNNAKLITFNAPPNLPNPRL